MKKSKNITKKTNNKLVIVLIISVALLIIGAYFFPRSKEQCAATSIKGSHCVTRRCAGILADPQQHAPTHYTCYGIDLGTSETYFEPNPLYKGE